MKNTNPSHNHIDSSSKPNDADIGSESGYDSADLIEHFGRVSAQIAEEYSVAKGVLVIRQQSTGRLAAISTWEHGQLHEGLTITLPAELSLFEQVITGGKLHVEKIDGDFSGNFFERKLLTVGTSGSIVLTPLTLSERTVGLVGYCSKKTDGFSKIVDETFGEVVATLSPLIDRKLTDS